MPWAQPVGRKLANPWNLHDMHGNVWEWVQDFYGADYYRNSLGTDPQGPTNGSDRVYRGGGFGDGTREARSAHRGDISPGARFATFGFRLLLKR